MENLKIGFLLHFYQPWWQSPKVLRRIAEECYWPVMKSLKKKSGFCFSVNINYSLLELLDEKIGKRDEDFILDDFRDIIHGFKRAAEERKVELLGGAAYHPIMPLIPKDLRILQMLADDAFKKALWGIERNCGGIFLPEMAWSQSILPDIENCGYEWTVLDDLPFEVQYGRVPFDRIPNISGRFKAFLRSNYWSNQIAAGFLDFKAFRERLGREFTRWTKNRPAYLVIALDAETFGHHHRGLAENFLAPMLEEWGSGGLGILAPLEEIGRLFPPENIREIGDCSWSTSKDDCRRDDPYPLWNSRFNPHHQNLWRLVNLALRHFGRQNINLSGNEIPGEMNLDCLKIVSSCHWWWISGRPWWNPEFMKIGAKKAMEIVGRRGSPEEIAEAQKLFEKLAALK